MPFKLSPDIAKLIAALVTDLDAHLYELRADFRSRPAEWRTSDEGQAAHEWLSELADLGDQLESFPSEP